MPKHYRRTHKTIIIPFTFKLGGTALSRKNDLEERLVEAFSSGVVRSGRNGQSIPKLTELQYDSPIELDVKFHFVRKYIGDIDNLLKVLFDVFQRLKIFRNDSCVRKVYASIEDESFLDCIAVTISKL